MLSKVQKCTNSSFKGNPRTAKNLDLFKLPGSSYVKPSLLCKTKNQLQKLDSSKVTIVNQKPSCELFAPQPKRIFDKDYTKAIPKYLLLPDNTVKPPTKLVCNRKLVKKPVKNMAAGEVDICAAIEMDMLKSPLELEGGAPQVEMSHDAFKRKRDRSPTPESEDLSPDQKQIKLSQPQITGQHNTVSDDIKKKAFLLQKQKYLKRKILDLSGDFETTCKIPKLC